MWQLIFYEDQHLLIVNTCKRSISFDEANVAKVVLQEELLEFSTNEELKLKFEKYPKLLENIW